MSKVKDIINYITSIYPLEDSMSFDNGITGLQFGDANSNVSKVMITLDITNKVLEDALEKGCDMIICHHPFMFNPLKNLNYNSVFGKKLIKVLSNKINIAAFHTCFDCGKDGMNDRLAKILGFTDVYQTTDIQKDALLRVGYVKEISAIDFAKYVKKTLQEESVKLIGDYNRTIKKVGIIGGSGAIDWQSAMYEGCDCFITGEVHHNNAIDIVDNNFLVIEVSHFAESFYKESLCKELKDKFIDCEFILSNESNPFKTI